MLATLLWVVVMLSVAHLVRNAPGHPFKTIRRFRSASRGLTALAAIDGPIEAAAGVRPSGRSEGQQPSRSSGPPEAAEPPTARALAPDEPPADTESPATSRDHVPAPETPLPLPALSSFATRPVGGGRAIRNRSAIGQVVAASRPKSAGTVLASRPRKRSQVVTAQVVTAKIGASVKAVDAAPRPRSKSGVDYFVVDDLGRPETARD